MANDQRPRAGLADRLMKLVWPGPPADLPERTRRRVIIYLIPYLFFLYILAYIDRVNVSVAALGMEKPPAEGRLGFDARIIGFGVGVFFWGYWILEMPSTLSVLPLGRPLRVCPHPGAVGPVLPSDRLHRPPLDGPPAGLAAGREPLAGERVAAGPTSPTCPTSPPSRSFYFLRFMLGLFEGGFFPSVILYLSLWFRPRDRGRAIATFMAAIPVSSMLGSPLSGAMLQLDWFGLPGWRWVFILQGAVPMLAGIVTLFFLPNRPQDAAWLPEDEKGWLVQELAGEQEARKGHGHLGWLGQAGVVLLMTGYYFCMNVTSYGLSMFMPTHHQVAIGRVRHLGRRAGRPALRGRSGRHASQWLALRPQPGAHRPRGRASGLPQPRAVPGRLVQRRRARSPC